MNPLGRFIREKPEGCLYHYTGAAGIIGIVEKRVLWASEYRHLNDRQEYRRGARLLRLELATSKLSQTQRNAFLNLVRQTQRSCFVLSFSENGDQLSQWRAYCPGGNGYALGFGQGNALFRVCKQYSFNLIRCVYDPAEQKKLCQYLVETYVDGFPGKDTDRPEDDLPVRVRAFFERYEWSLALAQVMSALKHPGFVEEKEWRLVSQYPDDLGPGLAFRPGRFGLTPYYELPIDVDKEPRHFDEVVVGPNSNMTAAQAALSLLLDKNETIAGNIQLSRTPFRQ